MISGIPTLCSIGSRVSLAALIALTLLPTLLQEHSVLGQQSQETNQPAAEDQSLSAVAPARHPVYSYQVINTYLHDPQAFTQGLVFHAGFLYESTGLVDSSSIRKVALESGQVLTKVNVPSPYFAEGLAIFNDRAIQLTWQHQIGFVYRLSDFQFLQNFSYAGEGWGLTDDGQMLIMSDGTDIIRFLDPQTFQVKRSIAVKDGVTPVIRLNELEYIDGEIFANVWLTDKIVRISPVSGKVNSTIDMTGLLTPAERLNADVLNGIAYDDATKRIFVTGKLWPKLFEVKFLIKRPTLSR
jgi:glutamine cyclotransferase